MMARKIRKKQVDGEKASESAEIVGSNEDLLTLILLSLPVKSLIRFKSVSKNWLLLITSPSFSSRKSKRFSRHLSGLLLRRIYKSPNTNPRYEFIPLDDEDVSVTHRIRRKSPLKNLNFVPTGYCNGLLLCKDSVPGGGSCRYYVFNPTTKECIATPIKTRVLKSGVQYTALGVNLVFDPRKSPHYTLTCIYGSNPMVFSNGEYRLVLEIYSSQTGVLRQVDCFLSLIGAVYSVGVYWNGAVNWIDCHGGGIYFNIDEERVGTFPRPPSMSYDEIRMYYGESNDHLHLIQTTSSLITKFDVYEMEKDYSGWFVKFHVDLQPLLNSFGMSINTKDIPYGVLGVVRKDEDGKSFVVLSIPRKVIRFNFEDGSFSKLREFTSTNDHVYNWSHSIPFVGSLHRL